MYVCISFGELNNVCVDNLPYTACVFCDIHFIIITNYTYTCVCVGY